MISENSVVFAVSNLSDQPQFTIVKREEHGGTLTFTYHFPLPISWHGDSYTWDKNHVVTEQEQGENEEQVLDNIRHRIQIILEWEHRRATENLNNLIEL